MKIGKQIRKLKGKNKKLILSIAIFVILTTVAGASASSSNLDQCRNGGIGAIPAPCNNLGGNSSWVNGNLNGQQAHYAEGQFIPYRITLSGLSPGNHNVQIKYAVTKGTKHAIDYLGTFSYTETIANGNNPCGDFISGCDPANPTSTVAIPSAALNGFPAGSGLNTFSGSEIPGTFAIWGGTFTSMDYVFQNVIENGDFKTQVELNFTIPSGSNGNAVISWGGHVAAEADWGIGNSSSAITGSPYHMINALLDGKSPGSQDRALATSAVLPTLIVYKFVNNDASQNPLFPSNWTINVSGCLSNCSFPGSSTGTVVSLTNNYNVTETGPSGYSATFSSGCSGAFPGGGTTLTCNVNNNFTATPGISLTKTASPNVYDQVGQIITYTYNITNTGNNILSGPFAVTDNQTGTTSPCGSGPLNPGGSTSCTANYIITQSDLDNGSVTNAATASGNGLTAGPVSTTVTAQQKPAISLTKSASPNTYDAVGQIITYSYEIKNTGNIDLSGPFSITDNQTGTFQCLSGGLNVGQLGNCSKNYTITQNDLDHGSVTNAATASGNGLSSNPATTTVNAQQRPAISLTKTASPSIYNAVGQIITYTYNITNTGNIDLSGPFSVTDNQTGTISPCGTGPLSPGASTSCTAGYTIKQSDIDNGSVTNAATASGNGVESPPATTTVPAIQIRHLSFVKSGALNITSGIVNYDVNATNDGTVTLNLVSITDPNIALACSPSLPTSLAPGSSISCSGTYSAQTTPFNTNTTITLASPDLVLVV